MNNVDCWQEEGKRKYKYGGRNSEMKNALGTEWLTEQKLKCPKCQRYVFVDSGFRYTYCPHCGARLGYPITQGDERSWWCWKISHVIEDFFENNQPAFCEDVLEIAAALQNNGDNESSEYLKNHLNVAKRKYCSGEEGPFWHAPTIIEAEEE